MCHYTMLDLFFHLHKSTSAGELKSLSSTFPHMLMDILLFKTHFPYQFQFCSGLWGTGIYLNCHQVRVWVDPRQVPSPPQVTHDNQTCTFTLLWGINLVCTFWGCGRNLEHLEKNTWKHAKLYKVGLFCVTKMVSYYMVKHKSGSVFLVNRLNTDRYE